MPVFIAPAANLSKAPTDLTASCTTASSTFGSDGDLSSVSSTISFAVSSSPLQVRRQQQQHRHAVADSITGCFSDVFRRYSIDYSRVLGTGKGSTVYKCQNLVSEEYYAVKTIHKDDHLSPKPKDLRREISLLRDLWEEAREEGEWHAGRCGGVIELVDLYEDKYNLHIVTELCRGGTLFDQINDRVDEHRRLSSEGLSAPRCFSDDDASTVLRQVLTALNFLHSHDICHRDVKPENILFLHPEGTKGPDGKEIGLTIRLVDLGLARYHHASSFEPRMSTVVGTCTFIAPEVLRRRYDRRCDHWSLGVVAYVMMCGYPPFVGDTNEEVCDAVRKGRYRFDPRHWKSASKDAKGFVQRLLKVNVKSRMGGKTAMEHPFISRVGVKGEGGGEGGGRPLGRYSSRIRRSIFRL